MLPSPFKHQQVEAEIRKLVQTLPIGTRLPAERKLATSHACNFLTIRRALKALVNEGIVVRRVGSGTFVSAHKVQESPVAHRIGVLICQGGNADSHRVLQAIASAALEQKVELRLRWVRDLHEDSLLLKEEGCAALTLPWFPHERIHEVTAFAHTCILPVSLLISTAGQENSFTERQGIQSEALPCMPTGLCEYFSKLGHRRIALLGPESPDNEEFGKALSTYVRYMTRENLPNICGLVKSGTQAMDQLAEQWSAYRGDLAVISHDDEHALRLMTAMHKIGLSAPRDFAIIGCNDTEASVYSDPPLSTLRDNFTYTGHWLLTNALALASHSPRRPLQLPRPQMLVRATCGGLARINDAFRAQLPALDLVTDERAPHQQALQKAI